MLVGSRAYNMLRVDYPISIGSFVAIICAHLFVLICSFYALQALGIYDVGFFDSRLRWDAGWYNSIVKNGYSYHTDKASNVAFFPLFPWLWQLTGLDSNGISVVNALIFLSALYLLAHSLKLKVSEVLLFISFPSIMFCYVPYSEALFFLGGTLILIGLKKESLWYLSIGIIITCLDRKIGGVFSLCILLTLFLTAHKYPNLKEVVVCLLLILLVFGVSSLVKQYQVFEAGVNFDYMDVIAQWYRVLRFPKLPLTTTNLHWHNVWLDFSALFLGITSGVLLIYSFYRKIWRTSLPLPPELVFSLLYLAGTTAIVLIFSPNFGGRGTNIHGLNRYLFATPFFITAIHYAAQRLQMTKKTLIAIILLAVLVWLSFAIPLHPSHFSFKFQILSILYFALTILYIRSFFKVLSDLRFQKYSPLIFTMNTIFQGLLMGKFMSGIWIG
ncbi:MAG: hypothetical protein RIF33_15245 [Cyclobacteriaceae bacterium]